MKLKEGMYVRTKITDNCNCVYIRKITEIDNENVFRNQICIDEDVIDGWGDERIYIDDEDILKASHNIIDLIEVGDYVNGEEITRVIPQDICGDEILDYQHIFVNNKEILEYEIKSIVTKEMFESMSYKIGDNKEE